MPCCRQELQHLCKKGAQDRQNAVLWQRFWHWPACSPGARPHRHLGHAAPSPVHCKFWLLPVHTQHYNGCQGQRASVPLPACSHRFRGLLFYLWVSCGPLAGELSYIQVMMIKGMHMLGTVRRTFLAIQLACWPTIKGFCTFVYL